MAGPGSAAVTRPAKSPMTGNGNSSHRSAKLDDGSQPIAVRRFAEQSPQKQPFNNRHIRLSQVKNAATPPPETSLSSKVHTE